MGQVGGFTGKEFLSLLGPCTLSSSSSVERRQLNEEALQWAHDRARRLDLELRIDSDEQGDIALLVVRGETLSDLDHLKLNELERLLEVSLSDRSLISWRHEHDLDDFCAVVLTAQDLRDLIVHQKH